MGMLGLVAETQYDQAGSVISTESESWRPRVEIGVAPLQIGQHPARRRPPDSWPREGPIQILHYFILCV